MSYQVLARKWRPRSFATLVGQEHVVKALSHALATGRLHHAWLFTGTRGVGKTTISRILAKALNCEQGVTAEPCGECSACRAIDADRFPDYVEMDAASNRGVEDMAALLDQAVYAPTQGRYKVYMIDEVHMLTGHAFNAMLKTLEEPPEHVKFILATTDPQKIPVTVLSRCLQFNLKQMPVGHIVEHLTHILTAESVSFEAGALRHIARAANGSMRDALSLLDQAIAHGAGSVSEAQVTQMLGTVGDDHLYAVLNALLVNDASALMTVVDDIASRSLSFDAALQTLATLLHRCALGQFAPEALAADERAQLQPYIEGWDPEYLQLAYQIAIQGRADLGLAPDEQAGFSMTLLRLLAFRPEQPPPLQRGGVPSRGAPGRQSPEATISEQPASSASAQSAPAARVDAPTAPVAVASRLPAEVSSGGESEVAPAPATVANPAPAMDTTAQTTEVLELQSQMDVKGAEEQGPVRAAAASPAPCARPPEEPEPPSWATEEVAPPWGWDDNAQESAAASVVPEPVPAAVAASSPSQQLDPAALEAPAQAAGAEMVDAQDVSALRDALQAQDWHRVQHVLRLGGLVRELAQHCEWLRWQTPMQTLELRLSRMHRHLLDMNPGLAGRLGEAIAEKLQHTFSVRIKVGDIAGETPAQRDAAERQARQAAAVAVLEQDLFVLGLIERFDASLIEQSVKPL